MAQVPRSINSQDTANNIKLMREGIDSIAKSIEESKKTEKKDSKNLSELTKIMRSFVKEQKAQAQAKAVASQTTSTPSATAAAAQTVAGTATSQGPTPAESQPPAQDTTSVPIPDILQRQTPSSQRPIPRSQLPTPANPSIGQRLGQIGQSLMTVGRAAAPFVGPAAAIAAPIALAAMSQRQIQEIKENPEAPGLENNPLAMQLRGEAQTVGQAGRQNRNRAVAAVYSNTIKDAVDSKMTDEELVEEFGRDRQQLREWLAKAKPGERYTPNEGGAVTPTVGAPMLAANANVNASVTTFPLQQIDTQVTAADRDEAKARGMRGDTGAAIIANRRQESEKEIRQRQIGDVLEQVNTQSDIQQTPVVPQPPAPPRITTPSIQDQNFNRLREQQRLNLGPEPSVSQAEAITGAPGERMVGTSPPVRPMPSRPIPGLPQRGEVIESTMTPQGRPYSGKPSTGLPGVETPAQVIPEQPKVQSAQQAQRQSSQIQFSEYKFSQADPENYEKFVEAKKKKEQEIYAEMIKPYGGEKAQPETRRTIREVARRKASTETIIQFRKEIEAAGAGSVKTEGESTVTPQRQEPTSMRVEETSTFDAGALAEKDPETHAKFVARQREIIKEKEVELEKRSDLSPMAKNVERQRIQSQAFELAAKEFAPQAARVGAATVRSTPDVGAMTVQNQDLQRGQAQAQQAPPVIVNNNNNSSTERVISPPAQPRVESTFSRYQESRFMPAW